MDAYYATLGTTAQVLAGFIAILAAFAMFHVEQLTNRFIHLLSTIAADDERGNVLLRFWPEHGGRQTVREQLAKLEPRSFPRPFLVLEAKDVLAQRDSAIVWTSRSSWVPLGCLVLTLAALPLGPAWEALDKTGTTAVCVSAALVVLDSAAIVVALWSAIRRFTRQ